MRDSDVLVSLMLSPHPSYPPLEMAACGGLVVTNSFGVKTPERMHELSPNILVAEPTIEAVATKIVEAVRRLGDVAARRAGAELGLPGSWDEAFAPVLDSVEASIAEIRSGPDRLDEVWRTTPRSEYDAHRLARIERRRALYPSPDGTDTAPVLSLMTPAWNTDPGYLRILARSVLTQDAPGGFEWVLVDNGSDRPDTIAALDELAQQPSVRFARLARNDGIVAGMRACLELATGRYIAPVDHDDVLAPDAVRVVTAELERNGWPALFYSDEDKLDLDVFFGPYHKPDWDPVLFANSCYIAHLCGVARDVALDIGAYDDPRAEASPDWDLFTRATLAGHVPLHIPEVLYSWRVHHGSTARGHEAKTNVGSSHHAVLDKLHAATPHPERFTLEPNRRSPGDNDWWLRRQHTGAPTIAEVRIAADDDLDALARRVQAAGAPFIHLLARGARPIDDEWSWEATGLFERFPDTAAVGGRLTQRHRVVAGPGHLGFGRGYDSPEVGQAVGAFGHLDLTAKQRSVDVVPADHCVVSTDVLVDALAAMAAAGAPAAQVGAWIGATARRAGRRVVTSPHVVADVDTVLDDAVSDDARHRFLVASAELMGATPTLSPRVDLRADRAWRPVDDEARAAHVRSLLDRPDVELPRYRDWLEMRVRERAGLGVPPGAPTFAVITPVYSGTEPSLLEALAASLDAQVLAPSEWIVATDGPVPTALEATLDALAGSRPSLRVVPRARGGILATMRAALEAATADYVVPVVGDDLLTADALATLARAAVAHERPALLFSDEDIVDRAGPRDPYLRPAWDPVLHTASSYIWHLLAVRRDVAAEVDVYGDGALEWCHDWDTVDRIAAAGHVPVHVPEVLYHWRHHGGSSTNTTAPTGAQRASVEHLLQRIIERTEAPKRFRVGDAPVWRGAAEPAVVRLPVDAPGVAMLVGGTDAAAFRRGVARTNDCPITWWGSWDESTVGAIADQLAGIIEPVVVVASDRVDLRRPGWLWEAIGLLELHPDAAAVCGRLVDTMGTIVDGAGVALPGGGWASPLAGRSVDDAGPFALAVKPHTIDVVETQLLVADRAALLDALATLPAATPWLDAGAELGRALAARSRRVVFCPTLEATTVAPVTPNGDAPAATTRHGLAGFVEALTSFR
jgi:glycosyltransferase involved in cell wall biosynthesis